MAASRNYRQATQTALTWLSDGTCYWPGCPERVIRLVNGEYKLALQVAHICAHSPGGPRYDPVMPAPDRNDFDNLILLCYVHHTTIDGTRWREYTVEILKEWKAEREAARGPALKTLGGVTEDRLQALIVDAIVSRNNEIQETLTRLERNDAQAAELLRELVNELGELRGRGSLLDPDVVSMADSAAHRLAHLQDTAGWLADAAQKLGHLQDSASSLDYAADKLGHPQDTASSLDDAADKLGHLQDTVGMLLSAAEQLQSAANDIRLFEGGL